MALVSRAGAILAASYNIHRCVGTDGLASPARIAEVLRRVDADVVALQEVDSALPEHGVDQLDYLAKTLGYEAVHGPTLVRHRGRYGNGLLTRLPVQAVRRLDLSIYGREPRGAIDADLELDGEIIRVVATHFGLRRRERHHQARVVIDALRASAPRPTIFLGDVNEWLPGAFALAQLGGFFGAPAAPPTFPARWPVLRLDRVLVSPREALAELRVERTPLTRVASDHVPIVARLHKEVLVSSTAAPLRQSG